MKLFEMIQNFHNDESGAVTVDWVVLTAAVVGLGLVVVSAADDGMSTLAGRISSEVGGMSVNGNDGTTPSQ
ncbi:pilus assembly protein [Actibacterium sp. D379-3]